MAKLLSGKVGITTFAGLSTSRNQIVGGQPTFIGLSEVEPSLGLSPQNDYVLYGDANGARRWGTLKNLDPERGSADKFPDFTNRALRGGTLKE